MKCIISVSIWISYHIYSYIYIYTSYNINMNEYQYEYLHQSIYLYIYIYNYSYIYIIHIHIYFSFHLAILFQGPAGEVHAASTARLGAGLWPREEPPGAAGCLGHLPGCRWRRCPGSHAIPHGMVVNAGQCWVMMENDSWDIYIYMDI